MDEPFVPSWAPSVSSASSTASGASAFVVPGTIVHRGSTPEPGFHHEQTIAFRPPPGPPPAWASNTHEHLGLPIDWVILAGSALVIVAWHVAWAQLEDSRRLVSKA